MTACIRRILPSLMSHWPSRIHYSSIHITIEQHVMFDPVALLAHSEAPQAAGWHQRRLQSRSVTTVLPTPLCLDLHGKCHDVKLKKRKLISSAFIYVGLLRCMALNATAARNCGMLCWRREDRKHWSSFPEHLASRAAAACYFTQRTLDTWHSGVCRAAISHR